MISWFSSSSTFITLTIKTTDGEVEEKIQIQSDESVRNLKTLIDEKFECDPDLQKLVFHGEILQDSKLLSFYKIIDTSTILLMNTKQQAQQQQQQQQQTEQTPIKRRSIFDKLNPYYQRESDLSQPGTSSNNHNNNNNNNEPKYFDPVLNELAKFHPELPMAVMQHSKSVGELMKDLNKQFETKSNDNEHKMNQQEQQSLAAYYYYLSLASLSAVTSSVATSVYQHLPSKQQISSSVQSIIKRPNSAEDHDNMVTSISWYQHLHKLISNTKEEKAAIDRLVTLGFNRKECIEAYLACDKDEVCAAVFLSQNQETKGNDMDNDNINDNDEEKKGDNIAIDASMGFIGDNSDKYNAGIVNKSVFFQQFQAWMRTIFDNDALYFRYLLIFMKEKMADMTCLEDINFNEEYLISIGFEHKTHRNRMIKAISLFVSNKNEFELWWNETIQFKKYLLLFKKYGIWEKEELLLQIRSGNDIINKIGITNKDDVESIWKHIDNLRNRHSLYCNVQQTPNITPNAYNMNYSAPPMDDNNNNNNNTVQKEGAVTQI